MDTTDMDTTDTTTSFAALRLSAETLGSLDAKGYLAPTPVQQEAIPHALAGKDLVVEFIKPLSEVHQQQSLLIL